MGYVLIGDYNPFNSPNNPLPIPAGNYDGFNIVVSGNTLGGGGSQLLPTEDVLSVLLNIGGEQITNASFTMLHFMTRRLFGAPSTIAPSGVSQATVLSCYLPATPDRTTLPNSYFFKNGSIGKIQINAGAALLADLVSTGCKVEVYGLTSSRPSIFVPRWFETVNPIVAGANRLNLPDTPNVTDIFALQRGAGGAIIVVQTDRVQVRSTGVGSNDMIEGSLQSLWSLANVLDYCELSEAPGAIDTSAETPQSIHIIPGHDRTVAASASAGVEMQYNAGGATVTSLQTLMHSCKFLGDNAYATRQQQQVAAISALRSLPREQAYKAGIAIQMLAGQSMSQAKVWVRDVLGIS